MVSVFCKRWQRKAEAKESTYDYRGEITGDTKNGFQRPLLREMVGCNGRYSFIGTHVSGIIGAIRNNGLGN